jgi:hypothetical protein
MLGHRNQPTGNESAPTGACSRSNIGSGPPRGAGQAKAPVSSPVNGVLDKVAGKPYLIRVLRLFKSVVSPLISETLNGDYNE